MNLICTTLSLWPQRSVVSIINIPPTLAVNKVERVGREAKHKLRKRDKPPPSSVVNRLPKMTSGLIQQVQNYPDQLSPAVLVRTSIHRDCKMKAISTITSYHTDPPEGAFRLPEVKDCPGVIVTIAKSSIPSAGLGLFLVSGPAEDHSVPPGTIIATYDGIFFKTQAERDHVKSDAYQSNYVWEGINPFNDQIIMVDGKDKTSYGPFINDGLSTKEANTEIVVGNDGKLYVKTTTWVNMHNEFFMSYGGPFWLDPNNWASLPRDVQMSVLKYYKCQPPTVTTTSESLCNTAVSTLDYDSRDTPYDEMSHENTHNILPTTDTLKNYDADNVKLHSNHTISDSGHNTHRIKVTRYSASRPSTNTTVTPPDSSGQLYRCFGTSRNGSTRISFPYLEDTLPALTQLLTKLQQIQRIEAPAVLRASLGSTATLPLIYWKKLDTTHYRDSPPDGACGWHTVAQLINRESTGRLLNLYTVQGLQKAAEILNNIGQISPYCSPEGLEGIHRATSWIRQKNPHSSCTLPYEYQLICGDFATFFPSQQATLFVQTSQAASGGDLLMPNDPHREWLRLHTTTGDPTEGHAFHTCTFPIEKIEALSAGKSFAQLSGGHFFLFPELSDEPFQCSTAIDDLARQLWDSVKGLETPLVIFPSHLVQSPNSRSPALTERTDDRKHEITSKHDTNTVKPNISMCSKSISVQTMPKGQYLSVQSSYGRDNTDQVRLTLGIIYSEQRKLIKQLFHSKTKTEFIHILTYMIQHNDQFTLCYWKQTDHTLYSSSIPDGACGWYTIATLKWRTSSMAQLNYQRIADCKTGMDIVKQLTSTSPNIRQETKVKSFQAQSWILSNRRTVFPDQYQLELNDFTEILHDTPVAIFTDSGVRNDSIINKMKDPGWIQMLHHTASPMGTEYLKWDDLMTITRRGNLAQLCGHHYWPFPYPTDDSRLCLEALQDLVLRIWDSMAGNQHDQYVTTPNTRNPHRTSSGTTGEDPHYSLNNLKHSATSPLDPNSSTSRPSPEMTGPTYSTVSPALDQITSTDHMQLYRKLRVARGGS